MPELPDLEVIRERLAPRLTGEVIAAVAVRRPIIVRNLLAGELADHLLGHAIVLRFLAGIGNAYADEILWRARIYPFRRRTSLSAAEIATLYQAMRDVLVEAIVTLRERTGEETNGEIRDFLAVHGKPGQPCPRCGNPISEVTRERRATHFCRTCQPGLLVRT